MEASQCLCGFSGSGVANFRTHYLPTMKILIILPLLKIVGKIVGTVLKIQKTIFANPFAKRVCGVSLPTGAYPYQGSALPPELWKQFFT
jgi:hypothetical protein